jgi:transmembrane sensor
MDNNHDIDISQFTKYLKVPQGTSKEVAWEKIEHKIFIEEEMRKPQRKVIPLYALASLAAAAIVYVVFYFGFTYSPKFSEEKTSQLGQVIKYWLPDSSLVELNSNSSIKYSFNKLNGSRSVMLKGDALFDVKKGKEFLVEFYGGEVKVLGTSFYISAYSPNMVQIDCIDGAVEVSLNNQIFTLNKGVGIKSFKGVNSSLYPCNEEDVRKRLEGIFYWDKITLAEIDELAEYRFGYSILLAPGLENRNFTGQLDLNDLHQSLMIISMAMNVNYSIDQERKTISINAK